MIIVVRSVNNITSMQEQSHPFCDASERLPVPDLFLQFLGKYVPPILLWIEHGCVAINYGISY